MKGALIILLFTACVGFILWFFDRKKHHGAPLVPPPEESKNQEDDKECCGLHLTCEKDSLSPFSPEIIYYDDEELDALAGRSPESFSEKEREELRDVLLTLRQEDIAGWARSLQLRNIQLPPDIRDELFLIVQEARRKNNH